MNYNIKKYLPVFLVMLSITILLGTSYALLRNQDMGVNTYVMNVGLLEVSFEDSETNSLNLTNMYPIPDEEGVNQTNELEFTIKNTGDFDATYNVYIEETSTSPEFKSVIRFVSNKNDTGYNSPKTLSEDYYIDQEGTLKVGETATYKVKTWLSIDADSTYMNKTFKARIVVDVLMEQQTTAAETIKESVVSYSVASASNFQGGLVAINGTTGLDYGLLYNETNASHTIREYRYSGPTVNNYIYYNCSDTAGGKSYGDLDYDYQSNCEVWRIIGIFKENDEEYLKIMRNNVLEAGTIPTTYTYEGIPYSIASSSTAANVFWNVEYSAIDNNDWTTAGLQYYLNTERDTNGVSGYLSRISTTSKNLIRETTYYLGNVIEDTDTTLTAYDNERKDVVCPSTVTSYSHNNSCNVWSGNQPSWNGKVALLYPSDYGYSATANYWSATKLLFDYSDAASATSWMQQTANHGSNEWLLSPASSYSDIVTVWDSAGYLNASDPGGDYGARSVLNLKSQIEILNGEGTSNSPYVVIE